MKYFFITTLIFLSSLAAFSQKTWTFSDFKTHHINSADTVYVVNFWATWCGPCVKELPAFEKTFQYYNGQPVKFYFLS